MRKDNIISVLVVEPNKKPYIKEIDNDYMAMQKEVGGHFQAIFPFNDKVAILCNEDAKYLRLPFNRCLINAAGEIYDILLGTFLIVGVSGTNFISLSPALKEKYEAQYHTPEVFKNTKDGLLIVRKPF